MHGVVDLTRPDPAFECVAEAARRRARPVPGAAVVRRDAEARLDARGSRQARSVDAEVTAQVTEALLVAVEVPARGLREVARGHLVVRIAGAVTAQEFGGEREAGVGRALVLGPVPVRQRQIRIAGRCGEL